MASVNIESTISTEVRGMSTPHTTESAHGKLYISMGNKGNVRGCSTLDVSINIVHSTLYKEMDIPVSFNLKHNADALDTLCDLIHSLASNVFSFHPYARLSRFLMMIRR